MELKKSIKADLEKSKSIFLEVGIVLSLGLCLLAFEWTTSDLKTNEFDVQEEEIVEEEQVAITMRDEAKPPPPPPPPQVVDELNVVEDDVELEDELILEDQDIDQDTQIDFADYGDEDEEGVDEGEVFMRVEQMPTFNGGKPEIEFRKYISNNSVFPNMAIENGIQGKVIVKFTVNKDGSLSEIEILKGVDPSLDKEAKRVIASSPKWTPGKQRGETVRVTYTFPIAFEFK